MSSRASAARESALSRPQPQPEEFVRPSDDADADAAMDGPRQHESDLGVGRPTPTSGPQELSPSAATPPPRVALPYQMPRRQHRSNHASQHAAHLKSDFDRRLAQPQPLAPSSAPPSSDAWGSHDEWALLPPLHIPQLGYGPLLPASILSLLIGAVLLVGIGLTYADRGWSSSGKAFHFLIHGACWFTAGIIGLVMAESSTVTLDFPRRELTVRRYRALLAMCCAVGRTTVPFSSFVAVELRPACCGGAPWRAAQEVFLVADHPLEGRREVAVVAKVPADEAEEELARWEEFLTHIAVSSIEVCPT